MQRIPMLYRVILTITVFLFSITSVQSEPANIGLLRDTLIAYHDSGAYGHAINTVIQRAKRFINHEAAINKHRQHPKKLAIVLDIDETSLSNYTSMVARQFSATQIQLHNEIIAANAPAIKPTLSLYNDAIRHGIAVFFVTGRTTSDKVPTESNLKKAGFTQWAGIYFKPNHYNKPSVIPYKSHARAEITRQGYTVIASIGDQISDVKGGYAEAGFKLPNPYYFLP